MKKLFVQLIACGILVGATGATAGVIAGTMDKQEGRITPIDEGEDNRVENGYRFEFEEAEITGKSQNSSDTPLADHMCVGQSLEFSKNFSNGFCMKNISAYNEPVSFTFELNSYVSEKASIELSIASKYDKKTKTWSSIDLSSSYSISNNGIAVSLADIKVPKGSSADVCGPSEFFAMVKTTFEIDIVKGVNKIVFDAEKVALNVDYFDIITESKITYTPARNLGSGDNLLSLIKAPTLTETGSLSVSCMHVGCIAGKDCTLPILSDPFYKAGTGEDEGKYIVTLFGKKFVF